MREYINTTGVKYMIVTSKNNNKYFYDNKTGHIIYVKDEDMLKQVKNKYVLANTAVNPAIVTEKNLKKYLYTDGNGFKQLILEITSGCNFRCKYCIYSEFYPYTRSHGKEMMMFETAKKAVDFYFENYIKVLKRNPMKKPIISFYGGEPLLNLAGLKQIVNYINTTYEEYGVSYNLTTNGLLCTKEAQEFLAENKFNVLISLDGYQENHDRNRVDAAGNPTFERVVANINDFIERYPEANVSVSVCFDYKTDLRKLVSFFDQFPLVATNVAQVQCSNSTYYEQFSLEDQKILIESYNEIKQRFFDQVADGSIRKDGFLYHYFGAMFGEFAYHPMSYEVQPEIRPFTGACIPGEKLYVSVDGTFRICEKINSSFVIGNINDGIDFEAISKVINDYNNLLHKRCEKCDISRLCKMCYKEFDGEYGFVNDVSICKNNREKTEQMLTDYVNLLEVNPKLFEEITSDYYDFSSKVGELA